MMKIILADDHTLFREAMVHYLQREEPDTEVKTADDFHGVMDLMFCGDPVDAILLDYRMPGMKGLNGVRVLHEKYPDIPVVLLSGFAEHSDVEKAREMGASGYFPKTLSGKTIFQGLKKIIGGDEYFPIDHNTGTLMPSFISDDQDRPLGFSSGPQESFLTDDFPRLTPRERQVLEFLVRGASNKEIAQILGLQVVTIKLYVRGICRKLGAKNRTQAALKAQKLRLSSF